MDEPNTQDCPNCGTPVSDLFCGHCGQSTRDFRVSVGSLFRDFFREAFDLDSVLLRSIKPLCIKPGFLTLEFIEGKRRSYLPPVRMYITISVIFFLSLSLTRGDGFQFSMDKDKTNETTSQKQKEDLEALQTKLNRMADDGTLPNSEQWLAQVDQALEGGAVSQADNVKTEDEVQADPPSEAALETTGPEEVDAPPVQESASSEAGVEEADLKTDDADQTETETNLNVEILRGEITDGSKIDNFTDELGNSLERRADKLKDMDEDEIKKALLPLIFKYASWAMFILMPIFALILKFLYIRRDPLYIDHLIFAFHMHSFAFLSMASAALLDFFLPMNLDALEAVIIILAIPLYLYKAMRRVYKQGRIKTMFKWAMLNFAYMFTLSIALFFVALASFWSALGD